MSKGRRAIDRAWRLIERRQARLWQAVAWRAWVVYAGVVFLVAGERRFNARPGRVRRSGRRCAGEQEVKTKHGSCIMHGTMGGAGSEVRAWAVRFGFRLPS